MINIIVKKEAPWRPFQKELGSFKSLHKKDPKKVSAMLPVEEQFSKEELARIHRAAHNTNLIMGGDTSIMNDEP